MDVLYWACKHGTSTPPLLIFIGFGTTPLGVKLDVSLLFLFYILLLISLRVPIGLELSFLRASMRITRDSLKTGSNRDIRIPHLR